MDLRTFRRNGPGLAECASEAAWRRLWADRRGRWSRDTRGPVSNVAASWPQFGYRGQTHSTCCAARVLARSRWGHRKSDVATALLARYATLWSLLCCGRSRLLSHLAIDEAGNEPGIDLFNLRRRSRRDTARSPSSPRLYLRVTLVVRSAVCVTLIQLPDFGSWSMSPSLISASGTCSVACSELITLSDRRGRSGYVHPPMIVPAIP